MPESVVVFNDFSGGDAGRARPEQAARTFRALNAWLYPSGLGPRPPFQDMGITGLPQAYIRTFDYLTVGDATVNFVWSFDTKSVYWSTPTYSAAAALAGTLTNFQDFSTNGGDSIDFVSRFGVGGRVGINGTGFSAASAIPAGATIAMVGEVEVVGGIGTTEGKLMWSDPGDPETWPVANVVPVGFGNQILGLFAQRNALIVFMRDGEVWSVTGVLGSGNEVLRRVDIGPRVPAPRIANPAVSHESMLWFTSGRQVHYFTGAQLKSMLRPDIPAPAGFLSTLWAVHPGHIAPLWGNDDFMVFGTLDKISDTAKKTVWAQAYRGGAWTRHHVPVTEFSAATISADSAEAIQVCTPAAQAGNVYLTTGSSPTTQAPKVYHFDSERGQPYLPVGTPPGGDSFNYVEPNHFDGGSGLPVIATFSAPEVWDEEGRQVTVKAVVVDYSYDPTFTPLATFSKFDISVEALQSPGSEAVRRSTVQVFTPPGGGTSADGTPMMRGQARFQMGDQGSGVGFRVRLDDWRGIVVHRISVLIDTAPGLF